ncbi:glucose-6-phosphate dehydrogenase assembly protein OpcA [Streptomyces tubbatahanensis]|uniref:Glucose-6-phosphate dehydrogenase assembly protein OpcA n=1 Tax=Streptomyces tubbatahanensis TaxID=2923272 RepID=A0ABY3XPN9_9ACTN|nr:glucose-6-phosphate dehydrogenase assembly protein OpcA [Streptomyces tubbatahanensis]UNS96380.1 glucose-6-phosphate dehydrogenase assembly protein OpcA [Streptomyces tubbatahanensis]
MNIDLTDTTSSRINAELVKARRSLGSPAMGMVLTLVIVTDEGNHYDALKAASGASKEHPSRILVVVRRPGRSPRDRARHRLDAEVRVGADVGEAGSGETVILRLHGELASHSHSVVLPLLLPDAPVVVWWPEDAPPNPAEDALGKLAQRRITDAAATEDPVGALSMRASSYAPGDTDLSWTRITPWRSMLAASLDQKLAAIDSAVVEGEEYNPSSELLALWLAERLRVPVERRISEGPGITGVRLETVDGQICLDRADGALAELAVPGQPDRHVALQRRTTAELLAEELRRLDPDEAYAEAVRFGVNKISGPDPAHPTPASPAPAPTEASGVTDAAAQGAVSPETAATERPTTTASSTPAKASSTSAKKKATSPSPSKTRTAKKGQK